MSSSCWTATIHAAKYVGSVTAKALATYVVAIAGADGIGRVALAEAMLESGDGEVHAGWTAPREEAGLPSAQQHLVSRFLAAAYRESAELTVIPVSETRGKAPRVSARKVTPPPHPQHGDTRRRECW
jgi:hypothetical protein